MAFDAMTLHRLARRLEVLGLPVVPAIVRKANFYLHDSDIPAGAEIGEGTVVGYGGLGIVIHPGARVGRHCLISQHVTLGGRAGSSGAPVLGDYVRVGPGARVLGPVHVGDFAVIGPNAVVLSDVPPGAVVAGIPAKELRIDADPAGSWEREMGRRLPDRRGDEAAFP